MCAQRRLRSAWASGQSDQSSLFAIRMKKLPIARTAKTDCGGMGGGGSALFPIPTPYFFTYRVNFSLLFTLYTNLEDIQMCVCVCAC